MPFKGRNEVHLARRVWHFCGVMVVYLLYDLVPADRTRPTALLICLPIIAIDIGRLFVPRLNRFLIKVLGPFIRERETNHLAGVSSLMVGALVIILFYQRNVVRLTLLFVAIADPMASYFGILYGRDKLIGNKSLQGSLAAFIVCFVLSGLFFFYVDLMRERLFIVCLISGLIGSVSELAPVGRLDDNLVFPVLCATLLTGMFYLFGGLL